jgi:hypothetical protein
MSEPYADYLHGIEPDPEEHEKAKVPESLDPSDLGSVFVGYLDLELDEWTAVWQRGGEFRDFSGTRSEVVQWARAQQASHWWIMDPAVKDYIPWGDNDSHQ